MFKPTTSCFVRPLVVVASISGLCDVPAQAGTSEDVTLGAKIYANYGAKLSDPPSEDEPTGDLISNGFEIQRVYLTTKAKIDDTFSVRITTDVGRTNDRQLELFLKYAYLQAKLGSDMKLRVGAAPTPYVGVSEKFWGHRWVAQSFTDQEGLLNSSDLGIHLQGDHSEGLVRWAASVVNGEGQGNPESNPTKATQVRVTVDPLNGGSISLPLTVFASKDVYTVDDVDGTTTMVGAIGLDHKLGKVWGEYAGADDGDTKGAGMSAAVVINIQDIASVIVRHDQWDPDTDTDDDGHTTLRAGLTRDIAKKTSVGLTYESTRPEVDSDLTSTGVFLRMQAGF
jgi:hypothetical protein